MVESGIRVHPYYIPQSCWSEAEGNAGFIRQDGGQLSLLPDESGVPISGGIVLAPTTWG